MKNGAPLLVLAVIILGLILVLNVSRQNNEVSNQSVTQNSQPTQSDSPKILSTKPDPLGGSTITADATVEITFSHPLENAPEFKHRIDPEIEYNLELSSDRKTVKITPKKAFVLGITYTLFISQDVKFEGGGRLDGEKIFHFKTIRYRGV